MERYHLPGKPGFKSLSHKPGVKQSAKISPQPEKWVLELLFLKYKPRQIHRSFCCFVLFSNNYSLSGHAKIKKALCWLAPLQGNIGNNLAYLF